MSASWPPPLGTSPVQARTGGSDVASGKSPSSAALLGRERELERIEALLSDAAAGRSQALFMVGEPGVGKTTLLQAGRARASAFTCLEARGVEAESTLAYGGLLGLLNPVRDRVADLTGYQAAALGSALGWTNGETTAGAFLLGAATLSLLAAAARHRPVLVLVDDWQWLDPESASAIAFAARRLGPDPVAFLLTARGGGSTAELGQQLPVLALPGLSASAAAMLLPARAAPRVVERLVKATQGNPLALVEVAARLDDAQWLGAAELPDPVPSGDRLREHFRATLKELSAPARTTVLHLALAGDGPAAADAMHAALGAAGIDVHESVQEACRLEVVVQDRSAYRFRHPLLRSAVLELASTDERREARAALARVLPANDRARVWHLAEAAVGTDPRRADELAAVAASDRERLGFAAAARAMERASDLTPEPELARARLALAAHDAFNAGDVGRVRALVARVLDDGVRDRSRGEALFTLGMLEQYAGSVPRAVEHLDEASYLLAGPPLIRALTELAIARFRLSDLSGMAECSHRIEEVADPDDAEQQLMAAFCSGAALLMAGELQAGAARLDVVRHLADRPALRHDARALMLMALAAGFTGQVARAVAVGAPRLDEVRRRGAIGVLVPCLAILAAGRAWVGDHAGAFADAGEAAELAEHLGYAADASVAVEMLAWQSAARGSHDNATTMLARARELTDRAGTTVHAAHHAITAAFCALCRGDLNEVVTVLEARIDADGGVGASGEPLGVAPLLVEAYLGLGRMDDARSLAVRFVDVVGPASPALSVALARRCQTLTASDEATADAMAVAALAAHAQAGDPFETARTRLLYGGRLRRTGHRIAAREHLASARDAFASMDLTHWLAVAERELAATGATARRRPDADNAPLTSQETRVAILTAQGLSNKEIAAALFLSPRTVERHLGNVFRKRGLRSRTELAVAYAHAAQHPPSNRPPSREPL
ncbi:AAA family ATPase [Nocardioides sp. S-58]|uniref:AAA family ATPase n=1 Tax=Nocardioides renjunii TaxID=3095075 RepID=A0ABU5KG02_9ACTN|nr:AAA family ATPase [Nocardioides sp. S-58]MDZ5663369.1 AAA family ATPase [Nocardioides sp. S-58]